MKANPLADCCVFALFDCHFKIWSVWTQHYGAGIQPDVALGVAAAWKIPSQRKDTLRETYIGVAGYVLGLTLLRFLIGIAATTSSEQLMATYSQAMPVSTGSTISGFLQSMLWILSFMTPITFITMQAKKFVTFRRTLAKDKVLQQTRGLRQK